MNADRDTARIVRSWLEVGATVLPDRVLDAVLDQVPATPQRRPRWPARRLNEMNTGWKLAFASAAVAVVVVAAIGINLVPRAGTVGGSPAALTPTAAATPTFTPTASPTLMPTSSPAPSGATPTAGSSEVVRAFPSARESTTPGRYSWDPDSKDWQGGFGGHGWMHKNASHLEVTFRKSDNTYGPGPTAVTVAGYDATYQEILVNSEDVLERHVWIVDIDGTPVTIAVDIRRDASGADRAEATAVIESISVERTTSKTGFKLAFDLLAGWDSG